MYDINLLLSCLMQQGINKWNMICTTVGNASMCLMFESEIFFYRSATIPELNVESHLKYTISEFC